MDIEIQNKKHEALFKNGKYQYTFTPTVATEKIKVYHMGCVGDTRLNHIQLERGNKVTSFVAPDKKVNSLSGIFKQLRDLDVQMRDTNSDLWGKIKLNNTGAILDFYNENIKTQLTTLAGKVNLAISELDNKVLKKSDVTVTSNGITLGSGKTIDGRTIASIMKVQPSSIDLISPLIRVTGNMVVDGTLEGRKIKANTLETGHHKAGSITTELLAANAVKAVNLDVDNAFIRKILANTAFINELFAKSAFINNMKTVSFDFTRGTGAYIQSQNGSMKWDLNNNSMILNGSSTIEFKSSSNVLYRDFNGQKTFINFIDDTTGTENALVAGGNRAGTFNPNDSTFVGMRIFPRSDSISFLADKLYMTGGYDEDNGFEINVLQSQIRPRNRKASDILIGSKNGELYSLRDILANIYENLVLLHDNKETATEYSYSLYANSNIGH